jgi:hopanoid biosynthesis associated RND transporter like protein HpnN
MLEKLVGYCLRWPWFVVALTLALTGGGAYLTSERFAIDTDTNHLFASTIPWRHNEAELYRQFPQLDDLIVAVIDGKTPQAAEDAAKRLSASLAGKPLISRSWRPEDSDFFKQNGILFLSADEIKRATATVIAQKEILLPLAEDPTLRGLVDALLGNLRDVGQSKRGTAMVAAGLDEIDGALAKVLAHEPARVSWEKMLSVGAPQAEKPTVDPNADETRRIVLIKPIIDYSALQPGADAIALVRQAAAELGVDAAHDLKLRLTGQVPLADDEFSTISENMGLNLTLTLVVVTLILFAALRSPKLILAVLATLLAGLALTAGAGILLIGRFNMISVAFAALFIGLGVDFGIQFATRYREERHRLNGGDDDIGAALRNAARNIGFSLTLAAVSLLAGFFCFLPTDFRGVSELGLIAGVGMIIAYAATLTFLPAAIKLLRPAPETRPIEVGSLAAIDRWIVGHRTVVILNALLIAVAGAPFLQHLIFDSNPMNLRSQKVESVAAFLDLSKNPQTAPNTIEILAPSLDKARELAQQIGALPEVDHVLTVDALLPKDQSDKLPAIENAAFQLRNVFAPKVKPAPSDAETVAALQTAARSLRGVREAPAPDPRQMRARAGRRAAAQAAQAQTEAAAQKPIEQVTRFADLLEALSKADPQTREAARVAVFADFERLVGEMRQAFGAKAVTPETLPENLERDWISAEGKYRVEVFPKGDGNDRHVMTAFAHAVRRLAPDASGPPIVVAEAGATVVEAFEEAGFYSFVAIFLILAVALRNPKDVALTLGPLVLAGIVSLEATDALHLSLNFANIIALPLMFAVGVAFHIYYVIAWRRGVVDMLASSLTRAIFFSALTTGTAFGSLIFSSHPGTASMGALLAISLFFTLLAAFIVVPAFLGPPPTQAKQEPTPNPAFPEHVEL